MDFKKYMICCSWILLLVGCGFKDCETLSCTDLTEDDKVELEILGVTIRDFTSFSYEYRDGLPVIFGADYTMLPVPGTQDEYLPGSGSAGISEIPAASRVYFLDEGGVELDALSYPFCFSQGRNNIILSDNAGSVPEGGRFTLVTQFGCTPAAANRIIHDYRKQDGTIQRVFDLELTQLRNWRNKVVPLICENEIC